MIEITELIRPFEQGVTRPYLCRASDGNEYVVKGTTTTRRGLIAEFVCAHLARCFGLPFPNFGIAYIDPSLSKYASSEVKAFGNGELFATELIPGLSEVTFDILQTKGLDLAKELFLFDYWIANGDRTLSEKGGNPNLFYQAQSEKFWVLDHNLAFDSELSTELFNETHLGRQAWIQSRDLLTREHYQPKLEACLSQLSAIFNDIPEQWEPTDDILNQIKVSLGRATNDNFWEQLT